MNKIIYGDCLDVLPTLPEKTVQCCVTSPPYFGLRDYGIDGQIGLEETPEQYVYKLVQVFREARRVLRDDGVLWLNLGDSYAGSWGNYAPGGIKGKQRPRTEQGQRWERSAYGDTSFLPPTANCNLPSKNLIGIPWRVAFALQADGWILRSDVIWHKPNCMPESVKDRPTKSHEYLFLLSKQERYYYDADSIRESLTETTKERWTELPTRTNVKPQKREAWASVEGETCYGAHPLGRNRRSVWSIPTSPLPMAHFATFPPKLVEPCILAGSRPGDLILDPFAGAGTTLLVAASHGRNYLGIELNAEYIRLAQERISKYLGMWQHAPLGEVTA